MRITDKINFRQPKYMLPAIVYIPLIATGYFVFDMFNTEVAETQDKNLQTTEFLNPNLPGAQIKNGDGIGGKYENMAKSYGRIADYSAVDNIERDNEEEKEAYESKYTEEDLAELVRQAEEKDDAAEVADAKAREAEALEALNKALAEARLRGQAAVAPVAQDTTQAGPPKEQIEVKGQIAEDSKAVKALDEEDKAQEVVKKVKVTSDYFNTLTQNEHEPKLIKAIIDEDVKATDGSRVRLRLLDDIEIGETVVKKGSYRKLIFIGDSITQGMESAYPEKSYAALVAQKLGVDFNNCGVGGLKMEPEFVQKSLSGTFDIAFLAFGVNDASLKTPLPLFAENCRRSLEILTGSMVKKIFMLLPLYWPDEDTPGILDEYRDILRDSARDFRNIEIIDGKRLLPHDRKYFADGVHPNADGMEIIAKNICNFIADKQV